ncbi:lymphocyte function-associated antigen 3-like [Eucyclogobius newberryi]|uniref:lymphocyte function-associated antigen 3-like n=1 Tax=Eucyclogobius newberryi TaxID=166745 RepID=UPI003B5AE451
MALLYFHWWFILNLTLVAGQYYVLKGREAILTPSLPKAPDDILWKHNGDKVITFNTAEECVFGSYEGRVTLAWTTAELSIADVRYEDSGEYELEAFIGDRPHQSQFMLKVLDKVSVPVIRCEMSEESGDGHNRSATLLCSSESDTPEALTIKWNVDGESHQGQTLPIALGNKQDDITYSCTANNPLLQETSSFMAKDCYTGSTTSKELLRLRMYLYLYSYS